MVVGQNIAFDRVSDEKFLVAGRDLTRALGYATPKEQQQRPHAERGVRIEVMLTIPYNCMQVRHGVRTPLSKSKRNPSQTKTKAKRVKAPHTHGENDMPVCINSLACVSKDFKL